MTAIKGIIGAFIGLFIVQVIIFVIFSFLGDPGFSDFFDILPCVYKAIFEADTWADCICSLMLYATPVITGFVVGMVTDNYVFVPISCLISSLIGFVMALIFTFIIVVVEGIINCSIDNMLLFAVLAGCFIPATRVIRIIGIETD